MRSTNHNINNPLKTVDIDPLRRVDSWHMPTVVGPISKEEYDLIKIYDPYTIYVVKDTNCTLTYLGDILIKSNMIKNRYYMSVDSNGNYVIYVDQNTGTRNDSNGMQLLVPICTYDHPQIAIDNLSKFNKVGSHDFRDFNIYSLIVSYINRNISTHEFIISILVEFNFREDPRLQNLNEFAISHNANRSQREFPGFYADQIRVLRDRKPESLFVLYSNLYDLIVKYNFFKDSKYHKNSDKKVDLSIEICDIRDILDFKQ